MKYPQWQPSMSGKESPYILQVCLCTNRCMYYVFINDIWGIQSETRLQSAFGRTKITFT